MTNYNFYEKNPKNFDFLKKQRGGRVDFSQIEMRSFHPFEKNRQNAVALLKTNPNYDKMKKKIVNLKDDNELR